MIFYKMIFNQLFTYFLIIGFVSCSAIQQEKILGKIQTGIDKLILTGDTPESLHQTVKEIKSIKNENFASDAVCKSCAKVINNVIVYRKSGANSGSMSVLLKNLCKIFTDWGSVACEGYVDIEMDTILFILDNRKNLTAERICAIHFQEHKCIDPYEKPWSIHIPPRTAISNDGNKDMHTNASTTINVLHLTDIHYDPLYLPGTEAKCDEPLCCQSGVPTVPENAAGFWGDYNVCDMPWHSVRDLMNTVQKHKDIDYVYFTGDIISHKSWNTSKDQNTEAIKKVYKILDDSFKNIKVFPILGNHESHPTDFYSPDNLNQTNISTQWILDLALEEWAKWLPQDDSIKATIRKGGFYTVLVKPGFRIIALNSNVCFTSNLWLIYEDTDPFDQLKFLVETLFYAERHNEKVHILSHIPPGEILCHKQWSHQFKRIVNRFAKTISAQFNGHTHLDEWRVFYNELNGTEPINVAFNGGSFTTFIGFNPNYRIYQVDSNDFMVTNYDHYIYNLTKANQNFNNNPNWFKLYSFKEAYGLPDLKLETFHKLLSRMSTSTDLKKQYFKFLVRNSDAQMREGCDEKCLNKWFCTITAVETADSVNC